MFQRIHSLIVSLSSRPFWRSKHAEWQAVRFDRRWQTDTRVRTPVAAMQGVPAELAIHAVHYEGSSIPKLQRALKVVQRHLGSTLARYSFVDFGSGKGLVVMLASRYPFHDIHGVEMASDLHAIAESNIRKFRAQQSRCAPITLVCGNALEFDLPAANLVAYLYNPFDAFVMRRCVARLVDAAGRDGQLIVVYVNPVHREIFDGDGRFERLFHDATLSVFRLRQAVGERGMADPNRAGGVA
jgi:hypothetical protein